MCPFWFSLRLGGGEPTVTSSPTWSRVTAHALARMPSTCVARCSMYSRVSLPVALPPISRKERESSSTGSSSSSSSRSFRFSISSLVTPVLMRLTTCVPVFIDSPRGQGIWSGFSCTRIGSWSEVCASPCATREAFRTVDPASPTPPRDNRMSSTLLLPLSPLARFPDTACGLKESPRSLFGCASLAVRPPLGRSAQNQPPLKSPPIRTGATPLGHTSLIHSVVPDIMTCLQSSPGGKYTFSSSICPHSVSTLSANAYPCRWSGSCRRDTVCLGFSLFDTRVRTPARGAKVPRITLHTSSWLPPYPYVCFLYHCNIRVSATDHLVELSDVPDFDQLPPETLRIPCQYSEGLFRAIPSGRSVPPPLRDVPFAPPLGYRLLPPPDSGRYCPFPFACSFNPLRPLSDEPRFAGVRPLVATCVVAWSVVVRDVVRCVRARPCLFPLVASVRGALTSSFRSHQLAEPSAYVVAVALDEASLLTVPWGDFCYPPRGALVHLVPKVAFKVQV
eukprot:1176213-Prorocentrum_minimum.AAC.1